MTYEENRVNIPVEQNVLFSRFKQKMTEVTLLKGNSNPGTIRVNYDAISATRAIGIYGAVQFCKKGLLSGSSV